MQIIAYYRVSTKRQGLSGLGLEGQREAVEAYASQHGVLRSLPKHIEVETVSGKRERPQLAEAIGHCNLIG